MESQAEQIKHSIIDELVEVLDSKLFKTLSEPVRVEILKFVMLNGRSDIGTIAEHMPQDRSVISRHLNLMYEVGILKSEKESRHMFFEINCQTFLDKLETITAQIRKCITECCPASDL
jgi:DNA-binding transcriptional ArsR family regulator